MMGHNVTPSMTNRLGAINSQAVRASCSRSVDRLLMEFIAIVKNQSGFALLRKSTHFLFVGYVPASSIHLAAASSKACFGDLTPVNASWIASCKAAEASL